MVNTATSKENQAKVLIDRIITLVGVKKLTVSSLKLEKNGFDFGYTITNKATGHRLDILANSEEVLIADVKDYNQGFEGYVSNLYRPIDTNRIVAYLRAFCHSGLLEEKTKHRRWFRLNSYYYTYSLKVEDKDGNFIFS